MCQLRARGAILTHRVPDEVFSTGARTVHGRVGPVLNRRPAPVDVAKPTAQAEAAKSADASETLVTTLSMRRRTLAFAAQVALIRLKRDFKNAGMTEAQVHEIIPDVPTNVRTATPMPSPGPEPSPSVAQASSASAAAITHNEAAASGR